MIRIEAETLLGYLTNCYGLLFVDEAAKKLIFWASLYLSLPSLLLLVPENSRAATSVVGSTRHIFAADLIISTIQVGPTIVSLIVIVVVNLKGHRSSHPEEYDSVSVEPLMLQEPTNEIAPLVLSTSEGSLAYFMPIEPHVFGISLEPFSMPRLPREMTGFWIVVKQFSDKLLS